MFPMRTGKVYVGPVRSHSAFDSDYHFRMSSKIDLARGARIRRLRHRRRRLQTVEARKKTTSRARRPNLKPRRDDARK